MLNFQNYEESLASFLEEQEENDCNITENQDQITDKETANYYIRKVKELQNEIQIIEDTAEQELKKQMERIEEWKRSTCSQYQFLLDKYISMLRDFWVNSGENKTMKLSHGSLCMRKMRSKTDFDDEAVLSFLQEHNLEEYITMKASVNKTNLKDKMFVENGNAYIETGGDNIKIEGIQVIEQASKFEVK